MKRSTLFSGVLILFSIVTIQAATGSDVVPINWARFSAPAPSDSLALKTKKLLLNEVKYYFNHYIDTLATNDSGLFRITAYYPNNDPYDLEVRYAAEGMMQISLALAAGAYDSAAVGRSEAVARSQLVKLVGSITALHLSNGGSYWGYTGNTTIHTTAYYAGYTGFSAWLVWNDLDDSTRTQVVRMVESEANRFNMDPPYCNDCTDDTQAESNSWSAFLLTLAVAMMPNHSNVSGWRERASQWMLSAFARESDLQRNRLVDGKLPREWISGWNAREPGYVYNHSVMHPDYMTLIYFKLYSILLQSLAGQVIPQAAIDNFDVVYKCFVDYIFTVPTFKAPGGTIYRPGKATIYYPNGTDYSIYAIDRFFEMDVFASLLPSVGDNVSIPASEWAEIRADTLIWMQSRFTTGQHYAPGEWDGYGGSPWILAEFYAGRGFGTSYLLQWLKAQDGLMPVGNWNLITPDTIPPAAPSALVATPLSPYSVNLSWSPATDIGSGFAYYLVYRDSVQIGITKDTFFMDQDLRQNTEYHCTITTLDWNNNESSKSTQAVVVTFNDTTALIIEKVTASNSRKVMVVFNKSVDSLTAVNTANYSIDGLSINSASINVDQNIVTLEVSAMTSNNAYMLSVGNVSDGSIPPHIIPAGTLVSFILSDLNNHLLGYWPMDEEMGRTIYDLSGGNNDGVCQNSYSHIPGKIDNGLHFVPKGYVLMTNPLSSLRFPYTLALWVNREDDSARSLLVTEDVSGQYFGTWMGISATGQVQIQFGNGGTPQPASRKTKASNSMVPKNVWTHVAAVVNSATDMTLYINGMDGEGTYSGTATSMAHSVLGKMQIGYQTSAVTPILHYQGGVDDIRVYDTALTQEQISRLASDPSVVTAGKMSVQGTFSLDATPNPFNPTVVIHFSLPIAQKVVLEIFDVKGGLVARLLDGQKDAGKHKLVWAGTQQASGVYLLRLQAGTNVLERKLVYLK